MWQPRFKMSSTAQKTSPTLCHCRATSVSISTSEQTRIERLRLSQNELAQLSTTASRYFVNNNNNNNNVNTVMSMSNFFVVCRDTFSLHTFSHTFRIRGHFVCQGKMMSYCPASVWFFLPKHTINNTLNLWHGNTVVWFCEIVGSNPNLYN